jgi:hypothetical protein
MSAGVTRMEGCGGFGGVAENFPLEGKKRSLIEDFTDPPPNPPNPPQTHPKRGKKGIGSAGKLPPPRPAECLPRALTAAGRITGEAHPRARHSDATVAKARAFAAQGMQHRDIGKALGVAYSTVWGWLHGRRPPIARVAVSPRWRRNAKVSATEAARLREKRAKARALEDLA